LEFRRSAGSPLATVILSHPANERGATGSRPPSYWLNVKFAQSVVRVPFRFFTDVEEKTLGKNCVDIKQQVDNAVRTKKS